MKKLITQIIKFGIVGVLAFFIDYGVMILLKEVFGIWYFLAAMISFTMSVVFNYIISMRYVFSGKEGMSKKKEFVIFIILSVLGLIINQLGMWILVDVVDIDYRISKFFVTAIVMVWNFVTRKIFLEG